MKLRIALVGTFALVASMSGLAQSSSDAWIGNWTLNVAKSKFDPGPGPKSETRTYEMTPDGVRMTVHVEPASGEPRTEISNYKLDGKPYPLSNNPDADAVAVTRVNSREIRATELRGGKVIGHVTRVVSKDGKVLTMTNSMTTAAGQSQRESRVYDRQ